MSNAQPKQDLDNKNYLVQIVNPILEPLMLEVVKAQPDNAVPQTFPLISAIAPLYGGLACQVIRRSSIRR